jgi:transposase-like protein
VQEAEMALRVVSMEELKLHVLQEPARTGETVAEVCRRRGISRETYYLYVRRFSEEGIAGLAPRSRECTRYPPHLRRHLPHERDSRRTGVQETRSEARVRVSPSATGMRSRSTTSSRSSSAVRTKSPTSSPRRSTHPDYKVKDKLENKLHDLVCDGKRTLRSVQRRIASDWQALYRSVYGVAPSD